MPQQLRPEGVSFGQDTQTLLVPDAWPRGGKNKPRIYGVKNSEATSEPETALRADLHQFDEHEFETNRHLNKRG